MYYELHLFVCENQRAPDKKSCGVTAAAFVENPVRFLRQLLKDNGIHQKIKIRVNRAGCFNRCQEGPVLVIYPAAVWYSYRSQADLTEIIQSHIINNTIVDRLRLPPL